MENTEPKKEHAEFIGPDRVFALQREDFTTPGGQEVVRVLFESRPPRLMPLTAYKLLVSEEPVDYTTLGEKKINAVVNAVVALMMEYDLTNLEVATMTDTMLVRIKNMFDKASHVALTKDLYGNAQVDAWVPGGNFSHYRTMLECDSIVRRAMNDNANASPTGEKDAE